MKSLTAFLKMTIVGGALYLIPIVLILIVLGKLHGMTTKVVAPLAQGLELHDIGGVNAARALAIVAVRSEERRVGKECRSAWSRGYRYTGETRARLGACWPA